MKAKWTRLATPLLMAAGSAPVPMLLAASNSEPLLMLWPLVYLLAASVCVWVSGKYRLILALLLSAGMLAAGIVSLPVVASLAMALAYIVLLLATLPSRLIITQGAVFGGVGIHVLSQLFLNMMADLPAGPVYQPARAPITISLLLFLTIALLTLNRFGLDASMPEGKGVPEIIRRKNRLLVWLMLGAALLISLIPALGRLLDTLWNWLRQAVAAVIRWLLALLPQPVTDATSGAGGADYTFSMGEAAQPSALMLWLERILLGIAAVACVLLLLWVLRVLWKKLCQLVRWLTERLQRYAASTAEDYVDEVQDTRVQGEERFARNARRRRISSRELAALPPRQRIRARYAILRSRHPEWPGSHTARQTLSDASAQIYERARYSDHEISEQDAAEFLK